MIQLTQFVFSTRINSIFKAWYCKTRMAQSSLMVHKPPSDLLPHQPDPDYLERVSNYVSEHEGELKRLKSPAGATWIVGDLDATIYEDDHDMVYAWENFYLKEEVSMQVLGVVEGTSLPGEQLVLMTSEDRNVYIYGERELFWVAPSFEHLCKNGIEYPPPVTYYHGDAFKDMTHEDWEEVKEGPVGKQLDKDHHQLVMSLKSNIMKHLPSTN